MSIRRKINRTLFIVSCAALAQAQTPAEPARLVRLNITAVDSSGQPAAGLTAEDFQITDQNKPQKIAVFRAAASQPAAPAGGKVYCNRPAAGAHATAVLLDFLNIVSAAERLDSARKLGPALKQLDSGESVYLYLMAPDGSIVPMHEIPKDAHASPDKNWTKDAESMLSSAGKKYNKPRPGGISQEDVVKRTYVALENIGNQLSILPGRRDIIWITSEAPWIMNPQVTCKADWWDCALYVPHLTVTLDHAGVMLDPFSYISLSIDYSRSMEEMAGLTGGRAYLNQEIGDVIKGFGQAAGNYNIAYAPPADNWDSKYHRLKVNSDKKGLKIQAKQHYYAVPDQRPIAGRQQGMMVAAYQAASEVSDIGISAVASKAGPNTLHVELRIDPADLVLHENGGQYTDVITLLNSARAASGPQGEPTLADVDIHLAKDQRAAGVKIARDFPIDGNTQKVRVIVLDKSGDSVGSLDVSVK